MFETFATENTENVSVVSKNSSSSADRSDDLPEDSVRVKIPAETTEQLVAVDAMNPSADPTVVEGPRVPLPPRRAIPRNLVCEELAIAAADNNLPAPFLIKLINQESGFNQNAVSPVGAQGVAQFMPATAAQMRLDDPFNPLKAVRASAQLLRNLLEQFGNKLGLAAAAYNAGPKRVQDWLDKKGKLPEETRHYVERITGRKADDWKANTVAQLRVPAHAPCQREAGLFAYNGPQTIPLPPMPPGSAPLVPVQTAKATKAAKGIVVASADEKAPLPAVKSKNGKLKTLTITVAAKAKPASVAGKAKPLAIAAKTKTVKGKNVRVAEARGSK